MFISLLFSDWRLFASIGLFVVFSVCVHEYMHAYVALKMGDPTAADMGHLTLSPFKQMGIISLLLLLFLGIAWGQIPVNPQNLPTRKQRLLVALAGVSGNLLLTLCFTVCGFLVLVWAPENEFAVRMLLYGAVLNIVLLIINLMPVPGFDGFLIIREFIRFDRKSSRDLANGTFFIIMMIMFFFIDKIYAAAEYIVGKLLLMLLYLRELAL